MPDHPRQAEIESWLGTPIEGESPCEQLVKRVCGIAGACNGYPACAPARQLLETEQQERQASGEPGHMTYASGQCKEADRDRGFFSSCADGADTGAQTAPSPPQPVEAQPVVPQPLSSACDLLVDKVCGGDNACSDQEACRLSRQLTDMSKQQRARNSFASVPQDNVAEAQCREALLDEEFFRRCR
jgi:hypothetical protein